MWDFLKHIVKELNTYSGAITLAGSSVRINSDSGSTLAITGSGDAVLGNGTSLTLGGAVVVRLIRQSMVNKYNSALMGGRPAPLT